MSAIGIDSKVSSLRDLDGGAGTLVRRLKPTVNRVLSLRDWDRVRCLVKSRNVDALLIADAICGKSAVRYPAQSRRDDTLLTADAIYGQDDVRLPSQSRRDNTLLTVGFNLRPRVPAPPTKSRRDDTLLTVSVTDKTGVVGDYADQGQIVKEEIRKQ